LKHLKVNNTIKSARDADRDKNEKDIKDLSKDINSNGNSRDISHLINDLKKNDHDDQSYN